MIVVQGVSKKFGKLTALKNVSLRFKSGECIALIGPNGCGKTTLMKSILNMVIPDSGEIFIDGKLIKHEHEYRRDIGYMPQIGRYPENMNISQVIETVRLLRGNKVEIDDDLFLQFNMQDLLRKKMSTLSGGTRQKVSALLAFMFSPKILILDEPTAGLDPLSAEVLKEKIIKEKTAGKLVIISSHQLAELDEIVSEVVFMSEGEVVFHKTKCALTDITSQHSISKAITHILKENIR